jgi:cyclophilin family peptidyl-prolyl cis-trans isomerase
VKVGDLIRWESVLTDDMDRHELSHGIVIKMSRTGHDTESAQVLFNDGETQWLDSDKLVVVSESR